MKGCGHREWDPLWPFCDDCMIDAYRAMWRADREAEREAWRRHYASQEASDRELEAEEAARIEQD